MGVRECDRFGCESIMCYRYSNRFGYICDSCFVEMLSAKPIKIQDFMASKKKSDKIVEALEEIYEDEFRCIDE